MLSMYRRRRRFFSGLDDSDDGHDPSQQGAFWSNLSFTRVMSLSFLASLFSGSNLFSSFQLLVVGSIIETGRRLCQWLIERLKFQLYLSARFDEGDPAYEWIVLFLTEEKVWRRSNDFKVNAKSSQRKWSIKTEPKAEIGENAEYVPTYESPQLFRWKGYWVEIKRSKSTTFMIDHNSGNLATIYVSIYTRNLSALSQLVEEARLRYIEITRPNVTVHIADMPSYGPDFVWSNVKHKARRPLSSIILLDGVIDSLVKDAREFIDAENWYIEAGIPYRRGYLLYGPPGTGKTSTIYALAGELGLEIYSLSLSASFVDDSFLQKAASSIPKGSILLIEDIDCAFPSPDDNAEEPLPPMPRYPGMVTSRYMGSSQRSAVTLSGLLNVLDGVGSEEGKLFFATTNYMENLDPALIRPGRIDKRIQYKLATPAQAASLFARFYAELCRKRAAEREADLRKAQSSKNPPSPEFEKHDAQTTVELLASQFASHIPEHRFSVAELQGYLLSCKKDPHGAVEGVCAWVEKELSDRAEKEAQKQERLRAEKDKKERKEVRKLEGTIQALSSMGMTVYPPTPSSSSLPSSGSLASPALTSRAPSMVAPVSGAGANGAVVPDGNVTPVDNSATTPPPTLRDGINGKDTTSVDTPPSLLTRAPSESSASEPTD